MIYRNKIERENRQQLHLKRFLWLILLTQMLAIARTSQTPKTLDEMAVLRCKRGDEYGR